MFLKAGRELSLTGRRDATRREILRDLKPKEDWTCSFENRVGKLTKNAGG